MKRKFFAGLVFSLALPALGQQPVPTAKPAPEPTRAREAQSPPQQQEVPTFTETAETEYVLLPVIVLDKKGRFVGKLRASSTTRSARSARSSRAGCRETTSRFSRSPRGT